MYIDCMVFGHADFKSELIFSVELILLEMNDSSTRRFIHFNRFSRISTLERFPKGNKLR